MQKVKWNPTSQLASQVLQTPLPARNYQPDWYKKLSAFAEKKPTFNKFGAADKTLKHCVPFSDATNSGYIMETWQDIQFEFNENESFNYYYPTMPKIISNRDHVAIDMGEGFHKVEFVFHPAWSPELPAGWSMLYTQPINRPELPFYVPSGIVDADKFISSKEESSIPFYVKKSFNGLLPMGTPIVQMIPIKRDSWVSKKMEFSETKQKIIDYEISKRFWSGYKKFAWSQKSYK